MQVACWKIEKIWKKRNKERLPEKEKNGSRDGEPRKVWSDR